MNLERLTAVMCGLAVGALVGPAFAESPFGAAALEKGGFVQQSPGVWVSEKDNVVQRIGVGQSSINALRSRLEDQLVTLQSNVTDTDESLFSILHVIGSMEHFRDMVDSSSEGLGGNEILGSGNNGCAAGAALPMASVSVPARSASMGFGPGWVVTPYLKLGMVFASPDGLPGTSSQFAFNGVTSSNDYGASLNVSLSSGGSSCSLYAVAWVTRITSGCSSWSDAYYSGPC